MEGKLCQLRISGEPQRHTYPTPTAEDAEYAEGKQHSGIGIKDI